MFDPRKLSPLHTVLKLTTCAFMLSAMAGSAQAAHIETERFSDVEAAVNAAKERHENVLVVFDIDNTLMTTELDIGSEHWFMWQADLMKQPQTEGNTGPAPIAPSIDALLTVQGWIYTMTRMRPSEPEIPAVIADWRSHNIKAIALTSRSPDIRDVTIRELKASGIDLGLSAIGPKGGYADRFTLPTTHGTAKENLYSEGIMLTDGQHKGDMLVGLIEKTGATIDAIIFVDDRVHHLDGMQKAFAGRAEEVTTVRYDHHRARKEAFFSSDKAEVITQWNALCEGIVGGLFGGNLPALIKSCK